MKLYFAIYCMFFMFSSTAQITWSDPIFTSPGDFGNYYPRISLDGNSDPMVSWGGGESVYFAKKEGASFLSPVKINNDSTKAYVANWTGADMASAGNDIYIGFMHKEWGKKSYFVHSSDGGNSFGPPTLIENYPDSTSRFPSITIDSDGNPIIAVMKMSTDGKNPHYVVRKSTDLGNSFVSESDVGKEAGIAGEACDCCPAAITNNGEHTAMIYRNNEDNVRDMHCGLSEDFGASFSQGFPVDNNEWKIFSCPSSGPDAVIIGDTIYSVFLSGTKCYFSKTNILDGNLESIVQLGSENLVGSQNFPRISSDGNSIAICWKENSGGQKLMVAFTEDITAGDAFVIDTLHQQSFYSADVALKGNMLHVVWQDIASGRVQYASGQYSEISGVQNESAYVQLSVFPNPVGSYLHLNIEEPKGSYIILNELGQNVQKGRLEGQISVQNLISGNYYLTGKWTDGKMFRTPFIKE